MNYKDFRNSCVKTDCICKTCTKDKGGKCIVGTCLSADFMKLCPVKTCEEYKERRK
jgi:hypothetical protein